MHAEIVHTKVTVLTLSLLFIAIAINGKKLKIPLIIMTNKRS